MQTKLKPIIEEWQKKFFDDYVQPTMQNHLDQMEHKIIMSIEKKAPPQSAMLMSYNNEDNGGLFSHFDS